MIKKGYGQWHNEKHRRNKEAILRILEQQPGLRKIDLHKKTGLSRHVLDKHLENLISVGDVVSAGRKQKRFYTKTYYEKLSEFLSESKEFLDFLARSGEGEEFWLWLPNMQHPEKIVKFKKVATKILRQD
jgi:predicted transcriptional regulator